MREEFDLEALVADLKPVSPIRVEHGLLLLFAATIIVSGIVAMHYGVRADIRAGEPEPLVILRSGALLLLGLATAVAVVAAARPAVGGQREGWLWTLAGAMLFPIAALVVLMWRGSVPDGMLRPDIGMYCLQISLGSAIFIGGVLTWWLRKGAVVDVNRAGWLTGLSAGSFGTFAYSLHCPMANIFYVGLWYSLAVALSACIGRFLVPRLIRW